MSEKCPDIKPTNFSSFIPQTGHQYKDLNKKTKKGFSFSLFEKDTLANIL
ncbi:MAG: hypothetical protein ACI936_002249 [Paraglaciecola sp.]|jgi:hypothetical protein